MNVVYHLKSSDRLKQEIKCDRIIDFIRILYTVNPLNIFLGGTIDNGDSFDWNSELIKELNEVDTTHPIMIYNPRRIEWNKDADKDELRKQIDWELYHLERADIIVMNILPNSKSPISLMELGLFAKEKKMIVFCGEKFYRYENVRMTCERYGVPFFNTNDMSTIKNEIVRYASYDKNYNYRSYLKVV